MDKGLLSKKLIKIRLDKYIILNKNKPVFYIYRIKRKYFIININI